jgi:hypothetical protein
VFDQPKMLLKDGRETNAHVNVSGATSHHELDSDPKKTASFYRTFVVEIKTRYHDMEGKPTIIDHRDVIFFRRTL